MGSAFNAGLAYWERREEVAAASTQLRRLAAAVDRSGDLSSFQYGQLFAAALDFAPTLIIELGRGLGNSTCVFTTAAQACDARVVSLCLSSDWRTGTLAAVAPLVPPSWLARLDAREQDIAAADFETMVDGAARVLVFWDAHGYHIADHVLGRLLPCIADRPHLVLMHDMSDVRHEGGAADGSYGGHGLWRGCDWSGPRLRLGHIDTAVEQGVAIVDFTSRNAVPFHTAAEQIHAVIGAHRFRVEAMERTLGELWSPSAHWCHFSLNERPGPYHFPVVARTHVPAPIAAPAPTPVPVTAPAAVRLRRARHSQSLEIVVTGRADDHGGPEFVERLAAAASHNHALLTRAGIAHTFTLVEWNPLPGRGLLAETVAARLPFWGRAYVVDPEWHGAISTNPRLQFLEFFAKNVAVRRSTADAILTTNSDVFLSTALVARLAEAPLEDEHVYRAVRYDVDRRCDWRAGGEAVLADPRQHVRVNELTAPEFSNASGDFLLLTRATWHRLRGFNETVRFAKIHKDAQFCHRAWIEGLPFDVLGPIWHLDHDGSYANAGALRGSPDAAYGPEWNWRDDYRNPDGWGLVAAIEETDSAGLVRLRHRAADSSGHDASVERVAADAAAVGRDFLSALAVAPGAIATWLAALGLRENARLAIGGPDWATPWLSAAARAAGHVVVGLYTADARVVGTVRCGHVARPVSAIDGADADAFVTGLLDSGVEARLRRAGYDGPVHAVLPAPSHALLPDLPSELAMLLDVQRADADDARGDADADAEKTLRAAALSALAGPGRFVHAYDAALGWEKRGRRDEAARTLAQVVAANDADQALRLRARFHLGRLCYERGDLEAARGHLLAVVQATPDHRRARGYLEVMDGSAGGAA